MSEENDGILGNLPRSRPGVRSEKRASAAKTKPAKAKAAPAKPKAKPKPKPAAAKPKAEPKAAPAPPPSPPPQQPSDPIGIALKAGETVALTGLKVAGKVASGVLRRLPRP